MTDETLPPHNVDAEESVLGSVLIDGELIKSLHLQASDFYYEQSQFIYQAMLKLKEKGVNPNQITVAQELKEQDKLETAGGAAHLSHLISICPTSLDCHYYAEIVSKLSSYRQLIAAGDRISAIGYEAKGEVAEALTRADNLILKLRASAGGNTIITPDDRARAMFDRYEKLYTIEGGIAISTGLADLDKKMGGGLFPGDLNIIAARPSMGKTAVAECISNFVSRQANVLFCSGEMDVGSLTDRDVAGLLKIKTDEIRVGGYSQELYQDIIDKAIPYIATLNVYYAETRRGFRFNTANIYQAAYEMVNRYGLGMIVIDYLGLLTDRDGSNRNEILGYITQNVKQMARELSVPVLLLHQLSRKVEEREDKRPQLHDLRESGHIEEDADNVLFIYRDNYYYTRNQWESKYPGKDYPENITEILVAKHRQGQPGRGVRLLWDAEAQTYRNLSKREQEQLV